MNCVSCDITIYCHFVRHCRYGWFSVRVGCRVQCLFKDITYCEHRCSCL